MKPRPVTQLDRKLAKVCQRCPVCRTARREQRGLAYEIVKSVEGAICPFCRAYERVHGHEAHAPLRDSSRRP
jgi:hypothetical protein